MINETLEIGTINIPAQVGSEAWEACWEKTAARTSLFGVQESFLRRQKRTWKRLCRKHGWGRAGVEGGPNPIFFDKDVWEKVSARVIQIHDKSGRKNKPGFNEARYLTELVLVHRELRFQAAILDTHWVPPFYVPKIFLTLSRIKSKKLARKLIREHTSKGRLVIFMGDTNIYRAFKLANLQWLRGKGIDKLGFAIPSGWSVVSKNARPFPAPTDHKQGVKGTVTLLIPENSKW